jgi:hypothetical protein
MDRSTTQIRPSIVAEIARWWQQSLNAGEERGDILASPEPCDVAARFQCSEEEALRGLTAGEQLHWGGQ